MRQSTRKLVRLFEIQRQVWKLCRLTIRTWPVQSSRSRKLCEFLFRDSSSRDTLENKKKGSTSYTSKLRHEELIFRKRDNRDEITTHALCSCRVKQLGRKFRDSDWLAWKRKRLLSFCHAIYRADRSDKNDDLYLYRISVG